MTGGLWTATDTVRGQGDPPRTVTGGSDRFRNTVKASTFALAMSAERIGSDAREWQWGKSAGHRGDLHYEPYVLTNCSWRSGESKTSRSRSWRTRRRCTHGARDSTGVESSRRPQSVNLFGMYYRRKSRQRFLLTHNLGDDAWAYSWTARRRSSPARRVASARAWPPRLLKAGAVVTITDVRQEVLDQTSLEFDRIPGAKHLAIVADGTNDGDVGRAVQGTVETFGRIDVLINNAQTAVTGINIEDQSVDDVMCGIDSGFLASFRYMKACFPYLKQSQGSVINFASQAGLLGNVGMVGYNAAKEANRALTRTAAREWAQHNITVNCIIPGMLTEGSKEFFDANPEHYKHSLAEHSAGPAR